MYFRSIRLYVFRSQINEGFFRLQLSELFIISSRAYFVQCGCFGKKKRKHREDFKVSIDQAIFRASVVGRGNKPGEEREGVV